MPLKSVMIFRRFAKLTVPKPVYFIVQLRSIIRHNYKLMIRVRLLVFGSTFSIE